MYCPWFGVCVHELVTATIVEGDGLAWQQPHLGGARDHARRRPFAVPRPSALKATTVDHDILTPNNTDRSIMTATTPACPRHNYYAESGNSFARRAGLDSSPRRHIGGTVTVLSSSFTTGLISGVSTHNGNPFA